MGTGCPAPTDGTLGEEDTGCSHAGSSSGPATLSEGWLSSGSLPQGPKCHWAVRPPEENLLGGWD